MNPKRIARSLIPKNAKPVLERAYRYTRGAVLYFGMGMPFNKVKLVGITGTNGKTTTTSYVNSILKAAGYKTALTTTVNTEIDGVYERNKQHLTSGTTQETYNFIKKAKAAGVDYAVIEVTGHALDQYRHWGLHYHGTGITNLSYEHMEYFKDMDDYAAAKARLFRKKPHVLALNNDDEWFDYYNNIETAPSAIKLSYGKLHSADVRITEIKTKTDGSSFTLTLDGDKVAIETSLVGMFNVYNATTAAVVCHGLGVPAKAIQEGIKNLDWVDGRVNPIDEGQDFAVFTDYAHTPDGLEKVLMSLKEMTKGKLILVQSAMDGRDPDKWPLLGEAAARHADSIFVCDEEAFKLPREVMRNAIIKGIKEAGGKDKYTEIEDRQEAIEAAIASAKKSDTVLVVPFGHITEMTFYDKTIHWDERAVVANAIRKKLGKKQKKLSKEPISS